MSGKSDGELILTVAAGPTFAYVSYRFHFVAALPSTNDLFIS